jgi:hypothetical protein
MGKNEDCSTAEMCEVCYWAAEERKIKEIK